MKSIQSGDELFHTEILEKIKNMIAAAEKPASEVSIIDYTKVA